MDEGTGDQDDWAIDSNLEETSQQIFFQPPYSLRHRAWQDIALQCHSQLEDSMREMVSSVHRILVWLPGVLLSAERQWDNPLHVATGGAGDFMIIPAGVRLKINTWHQGELMYVGIEPGWLEHINQDLMGGDRLKLMLQTPPFQDLLLQGILLNLKQEMEGNGLGDNAYLGQLKIMLAIHLLRHYTARSPQPLPQENGLSRQQLQQAIDYIYDNIGRAIKLDEIAHLLGISQYYFCRLFRKSVGMTPHQYVIAQRIERAKILLKQPQRQTIADIALSCGFSNQSHLCKHFRKLTGTTPNTYRREF